MKNGRARIKLFTPVTTRKGLESSLNVEGWRLEDYRTNENNWNDARTYVAVDGPTRLVLDKVMKGDRRDWQRMWNAFCDELNIERDQ